MAPSSFPVTLSEKEAARYLSVSVSTVRRWRKAGTGPAFFRFGGVLLYRKDALDLGATRSTMFRTAAFCQIRVTVVAPDIERVLRIEKAAVGLQRQGIGSGQPPGNDGCDPRDPAKRFTNILEDIGRIEDFTAGMDLAAFVSDPMTYDAVERCLERISEAANKPGTAAEEFCAGLPWPPIRGVGNRLRNEYDRIDGPRIWFMVERDLGLLKAAVQSALRRVGSDAE
jgi:excisionase family DNA binding protein